MANFLYNNYKALALSGDINLATGNIYVMLVTTGYQPGPNNAIDNDTVTGDITAEVAAGGGYNKGGQALASKLVSGDNTDDEGVFDAADVTWSSSTITASGAIIYESGATAATSWLIGYVDFGSEQSSSNGDFTIQWNSEGVINLN